MDWSSYKKCSVLIVLGALIFVLTGTGSRAQSGTTSLHGVVTDKSGAAVSEAKIILSNPEQGLNRQTASGLEGEYEFIALPPGTYTLDGSVDWWNNNGYNYVYVAVAAGDTGLPDWDNIGAGIAYGQLTNGYDVQTQFTLTQATQVSFGVVLNMGRDSNDGESLRFKSLKLYINH